MYGSSRCEADSGRVYFHDLVYPLEVDEADINDVETGAIAELALDWVHYSGVNTNKCSKLVRGLGRKDDIWHVGKEWKLEGCCDYI